MESQNQPPKKKKNRKIEGGRIIGVVVVLGIIGIIAGASSNHPDVTNSSDTSSGSQTTSGSDTSAGSTTGSNTGSDTGSETGADTGSNTGIQTGSSTGSSSSSQGSDTSSCYPLSDEGTCYEPGEYCRNSDQGTSGIAGDGKSITCTDNDGLRWEPN